MSILKEISLAGVAQIDERVECTEAITINASPFYRGYLSYLPNESMGGDSDPDYGLWSEVSKGGTRFDVLMGYLAGQSGSGGLPTGAGELAVDPQNGQVYSLSSQIVYARYLGHGPVRFHNADMSVPINYLLQNNLPYTLLSITPTQFRMFGSVEIDGGILQDEMAGDITFTLTNAASDGDSESFTFQKTGQRYQSFEFDAPIKATPDGRLILSTTNGKNFSNFTIWLRGL